MIQQLYSSLYGLVGHPLGHSFSRDYFNAWFANEGIDAEYVNFDLEDINLLPAVIYGNPKLRGINVTIPYKTAVLPYLDELASSARLVGAVNVIQFDRSGDKLRLIGHNTDIAGVVATIRQFEFRKGDRALVFGTGGASMAVTAGLTQLGIDHHRVSRSPKPGMLSYADLTPEMIADTRFLINATPLGTFPITDAAVDIPYIGVSGNNVAFDLVYNPGVTLFMRRCAEQGAAIVNGIHMLRTQAREAWRIWSQESQTP